MLVIHSYQISGGADDGQNVSLLNRAFLREGEFLAATEELDNLQGMRKPILHVLNGMFLSNHMLIESEKNVKIIDVPEKQGVAGGMESLR